MLTEGPIPTYVLNYFDYMIYLCLVIPDNILSKMLQNLVLHG